MEIRRIGVVGAGAMGSGIVQVCAKGGYEVTVCELNPDVLEVGLARVNKGIGRWADKGVVEVPAAAQMRARIKGTTELGELFESDLVIEAIVEDRELKESVFGALDQGCGPDAILASNTSSISITLLAAATSRPDRVIGMHFFNPVPLMTLVEVVRGESTSDEVVSLVVATAQALGKTPVQVNDSPGFVSNRVLMPMINEAVFCLQEGVATAEAIDAVMKLGMNHPMGPLRLADLIGLDVCLAIMEVLRSGYGDSKYRVCPLLRRKVDAGHLGRKSGQGFYSYSPRG